MADNSLPYDNGGRLEPGSPVMVSLAPDECVVVARDGEWRCIRDHECGPHRWWKASRPDWDEMTYDQQREFLGLPDLQVRDAKQRLREAIQLWAQLRKGDSRTVGEQ